MAKQPEQTRKALYEQAQQHKIEGRSSMSKAELATALERESFEEARPMVATRVDSFRRLAEAVAAGEFVLRPRVLTGHDRRQHVRQTLREDHEMPMRNVPSGWPMITSTRRKAAFGRPRNWCRSRAPRSCTIPRRPRVGRVQAVGLGAPVSASRPLPESTVQAN